MVRKYKVSVMAEVEADYPEEAVRRGATVVNQLVMDGQPVRGSAQRDDGWTWSGEVDTNLYPWVDEEDALARLLELYRTRTAAYDPASADDAEEDEANGNGNGVEP